MDDLTVLAAKALRYPGLRAGIAGMHKNGLHSLVLASDYRVPDARRISPALERWRPNLAAIGAHHVVLYTSTTDTGRVLVTIGIRHQQPVEELLRSRVIFEWFDQSGLDDIPAIFAGEIVEKIDTHEQRPEDVPAGVIVAAMSSVDDLATLLEQIHAGRDRFSRAGIRSTWVYRAFDDEREVMILQDIEDEQRALQWIEQPDAAAQWIIGTGSGPYPPVFVGTLAHVMTIQPEN